MKELRLSIKQMRAWANSSKGLTLIEVLIAIAVLGVIVVAFMSSLSTGSVALVVADERTTAESLARRQMEYIKSQGYQAESVIAEPVYQKIGGIPEGYLIYSVSRDGELVDEIVGIPWDSANNRPADRDVGLQKIALVIKHRQEGGEYKTIQTFINNNPYWADGVPMTLEGYKVDR